MSPKTFIIGVTQPDYDGLRAYLEHTDQLGFLEELEVARCLAPLDLVSFYAKLCYKSLVMGKNENLTGIRSIEDNLRSVMNSKHGAVFEHVWINFVTTDCSRVFTHELVRHRAGTAFSQTSGRYVSIDNIDLVLPPELQDDEVNHICPLCHGSVGHEGGPATCEVCGQKGSVTVAQMVETGRKNLTDYLVALRRMLITEDMSFADKKRLTSAIRRLAPNGQTNEIGWSCNVRALRHMIELRTSSHAEWEIREVFKDVAEQVTARWPMMTEILRDGSLRI